MANRTGPVVILGPPLDELSVGEVSDRERKGILGQFLTPTPVSDFMASLLDGHWEHIELLDAGAGEGALTRALIRRLCRHNNRPSSISVSAFELDSGLIDGLRATLSECDRDCHEARIAFSFTVMNEDFVAAAVPMVRGGLFSPEPPPFNAAIVNPPYHKIRSDSQTRLLLRSVGIETSNIYTAFLALIAELLVDGGELVSITPRSFCNGPYFKPFRKRFLESMSLRQIHVFDSRAAAFCADDVLQETIITHAVKARRKPKRVLMSMSSGRPDSPVSKKAVDYQDVVSSEDPEGFIHLVIDEEQSRIRSLMTKMPATLADLGLSVSTGRVVDFRVRPHLRQEASDDTVPLIYPCHFDGGFVQWPKVRCRKPNAIAINEETRDLLLPAGVYVLLKRFTAKEERRRLVACIYDPQRILSAFVAFENHVNVFHVGFEGVPMTLGRGLAAFLNSTVVDSFFRQFSGHTQVNATDLRMISYPSLAMLESLGQRIQDPGIPQSDLDHLVEEVVF